MYSTFSAAEVAREGRHGLVPGWCYRLSEESGELTKTPPAPIPDAWSERTWRLGSRQTWREAEHNNIGEGRCVVLAVQRLTRCRKGRNCRMLVVTDSQVVLGCFRKGRSSNQGLLYLARRLAGLQLGYNVRLSIRYVPSERNLADGPSRGAAYACVARDTQRKAARKRSTQR